MNLNLKRAVVKAKKMLEAGDPIEAVSALELAELQPMDLDSRKLIEKAKEEANIGSPQRAEHLLNLIDLNLGMLLSLVMVSSRAKPRVGSVLATWKDVGGLVSASAGKMASSLGLALME